MLQGFLSISRWFIVISWRLLWRAQQGLTWSNLWGKLDFSHAFLKWPTYTSVLSKHILVSHFQKAQVEGTCTCLCKLRFGVLFYFHSTNSELLRFFFFLRNFICSVKIACEVLNESTQSPFMFHHCVYFILCFPIGRSLKLKSIASYGMPTQRYKVQ